MVQKQKQKQKQTVIVNIGDKVIKRKRKRRKAPPRGQPAYRGGPPPPPFVQQTIYPTANLAKIDEVQFQLNSVVDQLKNIQNRQLHRTANLMAGVRAIERAEGEEGQIAFERVPEARVVGFTRAISAPPVLEKPPPPPPPERGRSKEKRKRATKAEMAQRRAMAGGGGAAAEPERRTGQSQGDVIFTGGPSVKINVPKKTKPIEGGGIPPRMFG